MAKTTTAKPNTQQYLVLTTMASRDGSVRWEPGSLIELDAIQAQIHLSLGNVSPLDHTTPPEPPEPPVTVHMPVTVNTPEEVPA